MIYPEWRRSSVIIISDEWTVHAQELFKESSNVVNLCSSIFPTKCFQNAQTGFTESLN